MKRLLVFLLTLFLAGPLWADKVKPVWTAQTTPTEASVDTQGSEAAQVNVWIASGSPNGTVTIYNVTPTGKRVWLAETVPSTWAGKTAKTLGGKIGVGLVVVLSGNTTGAVGADVVLK